MDYINNWKTAVCALIVTCVASALALQGKITFVEYVAFVTTAAGLFVAKDAGDKKG